MARDYLTDFELMLLLAILRLDDEAYGVPIAREIETTGGRTVIVAAVYTALDRLERTAWSRRAWETRRPSAAGARSGTSGSPRPG